LLKLTIWTTQYLVVVICYTNQLLHCCNNATLNCQKYFYHVAEIQIFDTDTRL